jgi:hypothetical protein
MAGLRRRRQRPGSLSGGAARRHPAPRTVLWDGIFPNDGVTVLACFVTKDKLPAFKADLEGSLVRIFDGLSRAPKIAEATRISKIIGVDH